MSKTFHNQKTESQMEPTQQDWLDYLAKLPAYQEAVRAYAESYQDDSENPAPPRPPKPPMFFGWEGEE